MMIATVLRSQPWVNPRGKTAEFTVDHAQWLHRQIRQHFDGEIVCFTDTPVPGVKNIPLLHDWPGWWAKLEMFRPDIEGDILFMDLDTIITGDLKRMVAMEKTTVLRDFYSMSDKIGSGLMFIKQEDKARVWEEFTRCPEQHMDECVTREKWGDQGFLNGIIGKTAQRWQDVLPGAVLSYKASGRRRPMRTCSVMCFHGDPRPWQTNHPWVPRLEVAQ